MRVIAMLLCLTGTLWAEGPSPEQLEFFESRIRPVLVAHCIECHGPKKQSGGLRLDSAAAVRAGGESGAIVVPGKPSESLLIEAVRYASLEMPPKGKLPDGVVADLVKWVELGVPDPREGGSTVTRKSIDIAAGRQFWAFRPVARARVPAVRDATWPTRDSDRFLLARLEAVGLRPSPDADADVLLRRVSFDLTGLPPSDVERADFRAAYAADPQRAVETLADRLLATPAFAEKWARHWLDLARYADSNGSSHNMPYPNAWRYRNWVIDSFAADRAYDDFVVRQIAGDLLSADTAAERDANLIATGYLMLGPKVLGLFDKETLTLDVADEQIDTIGKSLLGLTLGCARCHDHKFDPVPQRDYYALAGIFTSTITLEDRIGGPLEDESDWSRRGLGVGGDEAYRRFRERHRYEWVKLSVQVVTARRKVAGLEDRLGQADSAPRQTLSEQLAAAREELRKSAGKLAEIEVGLPPLALAPQEARQPSDTQLRVRGVAASRGDTVPRGFLQVAAFDGQPKVNPAQSGRLELARWIADARNPLTARVWVNRVWKHLFREGLVRSVDNFGVRGDPPSHPELLDALAAEFTADGWSTKRLIRRLVTSRAYRMSTAMAAASATVDPENRLLWRQHRRRLEPEEIRDTLLELAGELDRTPSRDGAIADLPPRDISNDPAVPRLGDNRRTIYQPIIRNLEFAELAVFDSASSSLSTGGRSATTVAPQALYFLNGPLAERTAQRLTVRLLGEATPRELQPIVRDAFTRIVGRAPTDGERAVLAVYLRKQFEGPPGPSNHDISKLCKTILASTQFQFLD